MWAGYNPFVNQASNISDRSLMSPTSKTSPPALACPTGWATNPPSVPATGSSTPPITSGRGRVPAARGLTPWRIRSKANDPPSSEYADRFMKPCTRTITNPSPGTPADAQHTMGRHNKTPYSEQWNFGVQRELANNLMLEVEYVGDGGRHMSLFTNRNDPDPGPGTVGLPGHFRPYPIR